MSKIKNVLKIGAVSALTLFGVENALAQDPIKANVEAITVISDSAKKDTLISKPKRNYLYTSDPWAKAEDGISISTSLHNLIITPTTNTELDSIIYAKLGNDFYKVVNSKNATKNIIKSINKSDSLFGKTKEPMIQRYLERLKDINKINTLDDSVYNTSCKILTKALEDKILSSGLDSLYDENGNCKITPGIYTLISKNKGESLPIYLNIKTFRNNNAVEFVNGFTGLLTGHNANDTTGQGKTAIAMFPTLQTANGPVFTKSINIFTESINKKMNEKGAKFPVKPVKVNEYPLEELIKNSSKEKYASNIFDVYVGSGLIGAGIGRQEGKLAGILNYAHGFSENMEEIIGPKTKLTEMYGKASTDKVGYNALGLSVEYHGKSLFAGAGAKLWGYNEQKSIDIAGKIKKKKDSKNIGSGNFYAGIKIGNTRIQAGLDTRKKIYGGIGRNF